MEVGERFFSTPYTASIPALLRYITLYLMLWAVRLPPPPEITVDIVGICAILIISVVSYDNTISPKSA
jgi:hypothetical protein